ncbi:MAG: hypothetical protein OEM38_02365 [Gammaproteobacteria bacterium]|nr:hypothetical protein [Gammaproteobacteria bacterium]
MKRAFILCYLLSLGFSQNRVLAAEPADKLVSPEIDNPSLPEKKLTPEELEVRKLELLMEQARQSMVKHDYRSAITSYTAVTRYEGTDFFQAALEYLGLARERNKQFSHAKAEYERYLRLFPKGEGASRVEQRLAGLLSAAFEPKKKLRKSKRALGKSGWVDYGSIMQFYRHDSELQQSIGNNYSASNVYSSFFYTAKIKTPSYEMKNRISLSNNYDFEEDDEDNDLLRVSKLSSEIHSRRLKLSGRVGRQTQNSSGAYGRFDGAVLAYHYNPRVALRMASGFPVDFGTYDSIQSNKHFYAANLEMESLFGYVDFNSYFVTQYFDNILNRQAMGLELRHFDKRLTFFTALDYDFSYSVLNNLVANVNYKVNRNHRVGSNVTYRRSPFIATTNALQGQTVLTLDEMLSVRTKDELRELARDRTARYASANISWQHKFSKNIELNYDYTISDLSGTTSSGGVLGNVGTGFEYYYSTQITATDIFTKYDVNILGLRFDTRSSGDRTTLNLMRRDRLSKKITFGTKFRMDYQKRTNGEILYDIRPSSKVNYKISRKYKLEFELGLQHRIRKYSFDASNETNGFFSLGYIAQF